MVRAPDPNLIASMAQRHGPEYSSLP